MAIDEVSHVTTPKDALQEQLQDFISLNILQPKSRCKEILSSDIRSKSEFKS